MTSFRDVATADLRLTVLRLLSEAQGYELNGSILRLALEDYGHRVGFDRLKSELVWLEDQGLLKLQSIAAGAMQVARLTQQGLDVSKGAARVPGVARPEPGLG